MMAQDRPTSLATLVDNALAGDRNAQTNLYTFLKPTIHRAAARVFQLSGRRRSELVDYMQEIVIHLILSDTLKAWDRSRPLEGYAYRIAYNKALDLVQNRLMNPWAMPVDAEHIEILLPPIAGRQDETAISRDALRQLYEALTKDEQALFQLIFIHERSLAEACALLGLPTDEKGADALRKKVARLRQKCRELLAAASGYPGENRKATNANDEDPESTSGPASDENEEP